MFISLQIKSGMKGLIMHLNLVEMTYAESEYGVMKNDSTMNIF